MTIHRYIYHNSSIERADPSKIWVNLHLLRGYCEQSLQNHKEYAEEIAQAFDGWIRADDVRMTTVIKSDWCNRFTVFTWSGELPRDLIPENWELRSQAPDYSLAA